MIEILLFTCSGILMARTEFPEYDGQHLAGDIEYAVIGDDAFTALDDDSDDDRSAQ